MRRIRCDCSNADRAHARGELEKALAFYEQALKVRPEFPEAEFQRGNALASLGRLAEADGAFRRAISYKKNWSLPYPRSASYSCDKTVTKTPTVFQPGINIRQQGQHRAAHAFWLRCAR